MSNMAELIRLAQRGRKAETRSKKIKAGVTAVIISISDALFLGWFLMLAIGVAHAEWVPMLPTIGYGPAILIVALTRGLFRSVTPRRNDG